MKHRIFEALPHRLLVQAEVEVRVKVKTREVEFEIVATVTIITVTAPVTRLSSLVNSPCLEWTKATAMAYFHLAHATGHNTDSSLSQTTRTTLFVNSSASYLPS